MSDFVIREVSFVDTQAITDIYNEAVREGGSSADLVERTLEQRQEWIDSHEPREKFPVVVIEDPEDGTIMGFASLSRFHAREGYSGNAELSYYVGSQWRGRGVGRALVNWLLNAARKRGFRQVVAVIFADNVGSQALMKSYKFTQWGLFPKAVENRGVFYDVSYWYKEL